MSGYQVTDSKQNEVLSPGGGVRSVHKVWIKTDRGASGSIDVEPEDWNKDALGKILSDFADKLDLPFTLGR